MTGKELNFIELSAFNNGYVKIQERNSIFTLGDILQKDNDTLLFTLEVNSDTGKVFKNGIEIV